MTLLYLPGVMCVASCQHTILTVCPQAHFVDFQWIWVPDDQAESAMEAIEQIGFRVAQFSHLPNVILAMSAVFFLSIEWMHWLSLNGWVGLILSIVAGSIALLSARELLMKAKHELEAGQVGMSAFLGISLVLMTWTNLGLAIAGCFSSINVLHLSMPLLMLLLQKIGGYVQWSVKKTLMGSTHSLSEYAHRLPEKYCKENEKIALNAGDNIPADGVAETAGVVFHWPQNGDFAPEEKVINLGEAVYQGDAVKASFSMRSEKSSQESGLFQRYQALRTLHAVKEYPMPLLRYFGVGVLVVAVLSFFAWGCWSGAWLQALMHAIAVLVAACPCSMTLAQPLMRSAAQSVGHPQGIDLHRVEKLSVLSKVSHIFSDKTGTLTMPELTKGLEVLKADELSILGSLVKDDCHPIAMAIAKLVPAKESVEVKRMPGQGLISGDYRLIRNKFYHGKKCLATLEFAEQWDLSWRDETPLTVLTGSDGGESSEISIYSRLTAMEKKEKIEDFLRKNPNQTVLYFGDGDNDEKIFSMEDPRLITVSVGKHSLLRQKADIAIDHISQWPAVKKLVKQMLEGEKENLVWSLGYNGFAVLLASGALMPLCHFSPSPLLALGMMAFSCLVLLLNTWRQKRVMQSAHSDQSSGTLWFFSMALGGSLWGLAFLCSLACGNTAGVLMLSFSHLSSMGHCCAGLMLAAYALLLTGAVAAGVEEPVKPSRSNLLD